VEKKKKEKKKKITKTIGRGMLSKGKQEAFWHTFKKF